ncbi:10244_t:CDS:2, partial [Racocetra fulgida]
MSIVAWPIFTDSAFYNSLKQFKIKLDEQESQYKNARMFLEKTKASRHDDNPNDASHDCQTDHKCHNECEFKEVHSDGIIPVCVHFAAHQGKHRCEVSHACSALCLCTKDIGHESIKGNETHKCDSEMHYCGEPCSLEATTSKGPYKCQNE